LSELIINNAVLMYIGVSVKHVHSVSTNN